MHRHDLKNLLQGLNPWWSKTWRPAMPGWAAPEDSHTRALLEQVEGLTRNSDLLVTGLRLSGKSFLLRLMIARLLRGEAYPGSCVCFCDLSLPAFRGVTLREVLDTWLESIPLEPGRSMRLFLDGVDHLKDWRDQLGGLVSDGFRITATALATPNPAGQESLGPPDLKAPLNLEALSFLEYLEVTGRATETRLPLAGLLDFLKLDHQSLLKLSKSLTRDLRHSFNDYLARGMFPGPARTRTRASGQRMIIRRLLAPTLREDLAARHQARQAAEVEPLLTHIATKGDTVLDLAEATRALGITGRQTIDNWAELLVASGIFQRIPPMGYGTTVKRGRDKLLAVHPAVSLSHLMAPGHSRLPPRLLGPALESAALLHLRRHLGPSLGSVSYHRGSGPRDAEADLVAETGMLKVAISVFQGSKARWPPRLMRLARFVEQEGCHHGLALCNGLAECQIIHPDDPEMRPVKHPDWGTVTIVPAALACLAWSLPAGGKHRHAPPAGF